MLINYLKSSESKLHEININYTFLFCLCFPVHQKLPKLKNKNHETEINIKQCKLLTVT